MDAPGYLRGNPRKVLAEIYWRSILAELFRRIVPGETFLCVVVDTTDMAATSEKLDWKSLEILRVLGETDEELTTSEIRETTGIEPNRIIRYRVSEYLEPAGLVETRQPTSEGTVVPAKRIQLTENGREVVADLGDRGDDDVSLNELPERLEQVDTRLHALEQQVEQNNDALEQRRETDSKVSATLNDIDQRLSTLETQFEAIQQQLDAA